MVATDVAARGLDVKDISYVINYDFPVDGVEVRAFLVMKITVRRVRHARTRLLVRKIK